MSDLTSRVLRLVTTGLELAETAVVGALDDAQRMLDEDLADLRGDLADREAEASAQS